MSNAKIQVELDLDSGSFTGKVTQAGSLIRSFNSDLGRAADSLKNIENRTTSFGSTLRGLVVTIDHTRGAIRALWDVTGEWVGDIAKAGGELERLRVLMAGLSHETDPLARTLDADKGFNFVTNLAQNAPFKIQAITDAFVKMRAAGLDPTDGSLRALSDSVARFGGTSDTLHNASIAIQQMAGKGVVSMEELRRQLGEAVPDAIQRMADGLGLSMADLVKRISKGTVEARSALQQMFFQMKLANDGAAEDMMKTWTGMLAKLETETMLFKDSIYRSGLGDALKEQVQTLSDFMTSNEGKQFASDLGAGLATVVRDLAELFQMIRSNWDTIKTTGELLVAAFVATKLTNGIIATVTGLKTMVGAFVSMATGVRASLASINATYASSMLRAQQYRTMATAAAEASNDAQVYAEKAKVGKIVAVTNAFIKIKEMEAAKYAEVALAANAEAVAIEGAAAKSRVAATAMEVALGPIGWITLALTAGITAWSMWGNAAADAMEKAHNAVAKGFATADDIKTIQGNLKKEEDAFMRHASAMRVIKNDIAQLQPGDTRKDIMAAYLDKELAAMQESGKRMLKINEDLQQANAQVEDEGVRDSVNATRREWDAKLKEINRGSEAARMALKSGLQGAQLDNAKFQELWTKGQKEIVGARVNAQAEFVQGQIDSLEKQFQAVGDKNSLTARKLSEQIELGRQKLKEIQNDTVAAGKIGEATYLNGKNSKKSKVDPQAQAFQTFLENLRGDIDKTKEQVLGLDGAWEKFLAQYDNGKGRFGKLTAEQLEGAHALITADADVTEQLKKHKEAEAALKKVQSDREKIQSRLTADLASMRDQMSGDVFSSVSGGMVQLNRQLQEMADGLDKAGKGWGVARLEFDQFAADARAQQAQIDAVKFGQDMKSIRDKANASLITSDKERARAELQIEIDKINRSVELEKKAGADDLAIAQMTYDAKLAIAARTAQFEHDNQPQWKKLLEGWSDLSKNMGQVWANAMQNMSDHLATFVETGKLDFKGLMTDILKQIEQALMNKVISQFAMFMLNMFGGGMSAGGSTAGFNMSEAYAGGQFANGGIMTSAGPVPLNKYAGGGIANTPQVALFGEGSMPEAYVPLPDGRRIPVAMQGGGGQSGAVNVQVNVINQSGHEVQAEQKGGPRFDGQKMILDVVMSAVSRPGRFRDTMKAATSN